MPRDFKSFVLFLMSTFFHWGAGTFVSFVLGIFPEGLLSRYYPNTRLEAFFPVIALVAFVLGLTVSARFRHGEGARWTWAFGLLWLLFGIHDIRSGWSPSWSKFPTSWDYAMANLFGPTSACSSSECLGEVIYTMPFVTSVTYSIGALFRRK